MGLFSFVGGIIGGGAAKKASRKAEAAQLEYLNKALAEQQKQNQWTQDAYDPYVDAGQAGLSNLLASMGLSGSDAQQKFLSGVQNSAVLESAVRNGEEALLQNSAATGGMRGGNTQRGLADFRADQYVNEMLRQQQQLYQVTGLGLGATGDAATFGQNYANNASNIYGQQGQVRAGGLLTRGGINSQMWNNAGSFLDNSAGSIAKTIGGFF